jgi:hypothetical protein
MTIKIVQPGAAVGDMDRNRHVELFGGFVERIKIAVGQEPVTFHRPQAHRNRAVFFRPANLIQSVRHAERRRHTHPA